MSKLDAIVVLPFFNREDAEKGVEMLSAAGWGALLIADAEVVERVRAYVLKNGLRPEVPS